MIFEGSQLPLPGRIKADLCVVGSGPGGLTAATIAAEAGMNVVLLEAGGLVTPGRMNQREHTMIPRLLWHGGGRTNLDQSVRIVQGHGVGGSSLHNINLCRRIPVGILESWRRRRGLEHLGLDVWDALYAEVESSLSVSVIPDEAVNAHNRLLQRGVERLGWKGGRLSHNRSGCVRSGFCELGCAYDAKNNALKVFAPRFIDAGGQLLCHVQAVQVLHDRGRARGVEARALDPNTLRPIGSIEVEAELVCLCASSTGTPAILERSKVPDPAQATGRSLRIHPAVMIAGEFEEEIRAWEGIPQSYECVEFLDLDGDPEAGDEDRIWIVPAFGHPMSVATMLSGHGVTHSETMKRYAHTAAFSAMLHDHTRGRVTPKGELDLSIDYWPDAADRQQLLGGLVAGARLLLAAGAKRVLVPGYPSWTLRPGDDPERLRAIDFQPGRLDVAAVHPMASVPMGDDPTLAAVGSDGRHHHLEGLWICDGSLFPTSIGVPPQLSIYALGLHVGRALSRGP